MNVLMLVKFSGHLRSSGPRMQEQLALQMHEKASAHAVWSEISQIHCRYKCAYNLIQSCLYYAEKPSLCCGHAIQHGKLPDLAGA